MAMTRPWYERGPEPMMLIDLRATANQWSVTTSAGGLTYIAFSTSLIAPGTIQLDDLATFNSTVAVNGPITLSSAVTIDGITGVNGAITLSSAVTIAGASVKVTGLGSTDPEVLGACWRTTDGLLHISSGST